MSGPAERAQIRIERKIPLPWLLSGVFALAAAGAGCVWNLANIARDVGDIKAGVERVTARQETQADRIDALAHRVDRLEISAQLREPKT
ncbi:hypothetical protein WS86_24460 [Burkholderia savannae]|uniref:hypothetical protein n=1 Tax=Burkholderia savannae TaxID=1637837 RepID=UPI0007580E03|nr:hypothetical protein [Burkholderia savannae]AOJ83784.1 hypothetical protein WS86_24460 [Burkholderia savannae]